MVQGVIFMVSIIQAARYLVNLSYGSDSNPMSPLKLQKMLYFSQGWSYVWDNKPLFSEQFEAWQFGPVNREVYFEFQKYGKNTIPFTESAGIDDLEAKTTLDGVWNSYSKYSAYELVELTHSQKPWQVAYDTQSIISNDSIREYFQTIYC